MSEPADPNYSKAFQNFVEQPDDIVGLLAYALYKRSINERKARGMDVLTKSQRNPQPHEVALHKASAEGFLRVFARRAIETETPLILTNGIAGAVGQIEDAIKTSNPIWASVLVGVLSWLVSILMTILVVYAAPGWVINLVNHVTPH